MPGEKEGEVGGKGFIRILFKLSEVTSEKHVGPTQQDRNPVFLIMSPWRSPTHTSANYFVLICLMNLAQRFYSFYGGYCCATGRLSRYYS